MSKSLIAIGLVLALAGCESLPNLSGEQDPTQPPPLERLTGKTVAERCNIYKTGLASALLIAPPASQARIVSIWAPLVERYCAARVMHDGTVTEEAETE